MPEMPAICPRSLMAVAELTLSPESGGSSCGVPSGAHTTARNCRTCGATQVGSCTLFSAQPTTWPRLFEPVAKPLLPPRVGRARMTPFSQTKPRQVWWVTEGKNAEQLQFSPKGSMALLSKKPEMRPRLFLTGQPTALFGPPRVPRSSTVPSRQRVAWVVASPGWFERPDAQPRLLMAFAPLLVPPRVPRLVTL